MRSVMQLPAAGQVIEFVLAARGGFVIGHLSGSFFRRIEGVGTFAAGNGVIAFGWERRLFAAVYVIIPSATVDRIVAGFAVDGIGVISACDGIVPPYRR